MFCRNCGKEIPENSYFCRYCGKAQPRPDDPADATAVDATAADATAMGATAADAAAAEFKRADSAAPERGGEPFRRDETGTFRPAAAAAEVAPRRRSGRRIGIVLGLCAAAAVVAFAAFLMLEMFPQAGRGGQGTGAAVSAGASSAGGSASGAAASSGDASAQSGSASAALSGSSAVAYRSYVNGRFGFSVDYPSDLQAGEQPANGDGLVFTSSDGSVQLRASGSNNVLPVTPAAYLQRLLSKHPSATYHMVKDERCVISWEEDGHIFYEKAVVGTGSINDFQFAYPASQKQEYDPIVTHIADSFRTPGVAQAH